MSKYFKMKFGNSTELREYTKNGHKPVPIETSSLLRILRKYEKIEEERDRYKKALEEIINHDNNIEPFHWVDIAKDALEGVNNEY